MLKRLNDFKLIASLLLSLSLISTTSNCALADVTAETLINSSPEEIRTDRPVITLTPLQSKALELLEMGKIKHAHKLLEESIDKTNNPETIYLLSVFQWKEGKYKECGEGLEAVLKTERVKVPLNKRRIFLLLKRQADCYYQNRNLDNALDLYLQALDLTSDITVPNKLLVNLYENIVGTLLYDKKHLEAEKYAKQLVALNTRLAKSNSIAAKSSLLWANLQLLNILRLQNKETEHLALRDKTIKILDELMDLRVELEEAGKIESIEQVRKLFLNEYIKDNNPETLSEYLWLANEYHPHSLPLIEWRPDKGQDIEAVILCVHGLGLDNHAFGPFAKEMNKRGFMIYAMDVRGFGAWLTVPGQEDVGFGDTLHDIKTIVGIIKKRHPGKPVYLLGESMGGGIALRAGAQHEDIIDGIIASVPSAERFQGKRMGLTVAVHFLRDTNRPFDIGHTVATQATTNEALQNAWEESFKAKMKMTPIELVKFAVFMRTTLMHCKEIKNTPVFIVQGLKDRLVKPQGTYKMFDAVKSDDKILVIIGEAEHLIFENDRQSTILLDSLSSWLRRHADIVESDEQKSNKAN